MTDINLKEAFDIYQKQSDTTHKIWAYFQIVSIAVLGYTVGSEKIHWGNSTYLLISASYVLFAIANQIVIISSHRELEAFGMAVNEAAKQSDFIGNKFSVKTVQPIFVWIFHTIAIMIVLIAIWVTWLGSVH